MKNLLTTLLYIIARKVNKVECFPALSFILCLLILSVLEMILW